LLGVRLALFTGAGISVAAALVLATSSLRMYKGDPQLPSPAGALADQVASKQ